MNSLIYIYTILFTFVSILTALLIYLMLFSLFILQYAWMEVLQLSTLILELVQEFIAGLFTFRLIILEFYVRSIYFA